MRALILWWVIVVPGVVWAGGPVQAGAVEKSSLVEDLLGRIIRAVDQDYATAKYRELVIKHEGIDRELSALVHFSHPGLEAKATAIARKHHEAVCKADGIEAELPVLTLVFLADLNRRSPGLRNEMLALVFKEHPKVLGDAAVLIADRHPGLVKDLMKVGGEIFLKFE